MLIFPNSRFPLTSQSNKRYLEGSIIGLLFLYAEILQTKTNMSQIRPPFSREETDNKDNTDDTVDKVDTYDTDDTFGILLGYFWDACGILCECFFNTLWILFGYFLDTFGYLLVFFFLYFWVLLGTFWYFWYFKVLLVLFTF